MANQYQTESDAPVIEQAQLDLLPDDVPIVSAQEVEQPAAPVATQEAPPPEPTPTPDPGIEAREQALRQREQEIAAQQRQAAELQRQVELQKTQAEQDKEIAEYRNRLANMGLMDNDIETLVQEKRQDIVTRLQAQDAARQERAYLDAQRQVALIMSAEYGIPYEQIATMASPQEMEAAGKAYKANLTQSQEIEDLKRQITELKQGTVPAAQFETGASTVSELSGEALEIAVGEGRISLTPDVQQRLTEYYKKQGFGR